MKREKHLSLELSRLNSDSAWSQKCEGLSFLFLKGGTGKYITKTNTFSLGPGDVLGLNGEATGRLTSVKGTEITFWSFSIRLEHLFPLFAGEEIALLKDVSARLVEPTRIPAGSPLANQCHDLVQKVPDQCNLDHRSQLLRVAALIVGEEFKRGKRQREGYVRIEDHMVKVFESLSAEELLSLSVDEMAGRFGCSRRHLSRLFHQYFGFSVAALRMEMRLLKAVALLRDPNIKVIEVAERCSFNHLGLFNNCFKKRFGSSPGQWRKTSNEIAVHHHADVEADSSCPLRSKGLCPWTGKPEIFHCDTPLTVVSGNGSSIRPLRELPDGDNHTHDQPLPIHPPVHRPQRSTAIRVGM